MKNYGQNILYGTASSSYTFKVINQEISLALGRSGNPSSFNATEAIIITYDDIPHYVNRYTLFKYQAVIATDYTNTFAILNYERLDRNGNAIGYSDPSCNFHKYFATSSDQTDLTRTSNVGIPGKHIFLLTRQECRETSKYHVYKGIKQI